MALVKIENGAVSQYPYSIGMLRRDNKNVSFPKAIPDETLAEFGVHSVTVADKPDYDERTHRISQFKAILWRASTSAPGDGSWVVGWDTEAKTADEVQEYDDAAAASVRKERNNLLAASDWVVIMHTEKGTNIPASWEIYRQALRDVTSQAGFPNNVTYPAKP
jgi:hypothetical protein